MKNFEYNYPLIKQHTHHRRADLCSASINMLQIMSTSMGRHTEQYFSHPTACPHGCHIHKEMSKVTHTELVNA